MIFDAVGGAVMYFLDKSSSGRQQQGVVFHDDSGNDDASDVRW